jgi:Xaa-Pro aminopeptidase
MSRLNERQREEAQKLIKDYSDVVSQMQLDLDQHDSVVDFAERTHITLVEIVPAIVKLRALSAEIEADEMQRSMEMSVPRPWYGFT